MFNYLIDPLTINQFYNDYYEKRHLLLKRKKTNYYNQLLKLDDLDDFFYKSVINYPTIKVVNSEHGEVHVGKHPVNEKNNYIQDPDKIIDFFHKGYTIVINNAQKRLATLAELTNKLNNFFHYRTGANVYITPKGSQGFPCHYDTHDVFVLQIRGSKEWRIFSEKYNLPDRREPYDRNNSKPGSVIDSFTLESGDLLYVPRGVVHEATCTNENSIHITIGVFGVYWYEFLQKAVSKYSINKTLLKRIPRIENLKDFSVDDALKEEILEELKEIVSLIEEEILTHSIAISKENNRSINLTNFKQAYEIDEVTASSLIIASKNDNVSYKELGDEIIIYNRLNRLRLPVELKEFICELKRLNIPMAVKKIGNNLEEETKVYLIKQLIKIDFIKLVQLR